jgi:RES domain-containing protein
MIAFRQVDARYPFLWEDARQPAGRWHADGDGPAHYFADTPDGAWAEFLRHEEITDVDDLPTIRRQMWAVEIGDAHPVRVDLPPAVLRGGPETYARCQHAAAALRRRGASRIVARSAALVPGAAMPIRARDGVRRDGAQDGRVIVIFGPPADLAGWIAADAASPSADLLERVNYY